MFTAKYFEYDGVSSSIYDLQIVSFDSQNISESSPVSAELASIHAPWSTKVFHGGITYSSPQTCEFSIVSPSEISGSTRSTIMSWLVGRKSFLPFVVPQGNLGNVTYGCVFTSAAPIFVDGVCHGFKLNASFDSPYGKAASTSGSNSPSSTFSISNYSEIMDGYTYPTIEIRNTSGSVGSVTIVNNTDSSSRSFVLTGIAAGDVVKIDNEARIITSNSNSKYISKFNKNWLRMKRGTNSFSVTSNCSVKITCPHYVMIGY